VLVDPLDDRENLIGLRQHLVLKKNYIALHLTHVSLKSTKTRVMALQNVHDLTQLVLDTPQVCKRDVRHLLRISRIGIRFSHARII